MHNLKYSNASFDQQILTCETDLMRKIYYGGSDHGVKPETMGTDHGSEITNGFAIIDQRQTQCSGIAIGGGGNAPTPCTDIYSYTDGPVLFGTTQ